MKMKKPKPTKKQKEQTKEGFLFLYEMWKMGKIKL